MSMRQFDTTAAPVVRGLPERQMAGGKSVISATVTPKAADCDGLSPIASRIGVLPVPAQAATLSRLDGGRLDRAGTVLLRLQRQHGNRYVQRLVEHVQRHADGPQRDQDEVGAGEQVRSTLRSGGAPLDPSFRTTAESFLGADLSQVRVHTGAAAAESARAVQAHAYTSGAHVVFDQGMYDTRSPAGRSRLMHELAHVVQQRRGPVAGTRSASGLSLSDPSDRFEREASQMGAAFASAATPQVEGEDMHHGVLGRSVVGRKLSAS
ncbi:MAG: DUF4157 domain-containing protein [Pseudonocardiaceae bacterium]